jgi:hypothetical protein
MAQATSIVLADAQVTPVNHTFIPLGKDSNDTYWFEDQSQASPVGFWKISVKLNRPTPAQPGQDTSRRVIRAQVRLFEPLLENVTNSTVSGVAPSPQISYTPYLDVTFHLPERSALIDRQNLRKMGALLLGNANIVSVVETLQYLT